MFYTNSDGILVEDKARSNIKISHAFYTELIDQKTSYLLSGFNVYSENDGFDKEIKSYFNDDFKTQISETIENASKIGFSYMYAQFGKDFKTHFKYADGIGIIEILDAKTDELKYIINHHIVRENEENKDKITSVEVWDKTQVYYYIIKNKTLQKDLTKDINPRPHKVWRELNDTPKTALKGEGFKFIPFFRLDNNYNQLSDLRPIKGLIDDYDLMSCGLSNNLQDISEGIYVIKGFDLKCDKIERRLRAFLQPITEIIIDEINKNNGTNYEYDDVCFDFKREVMANGIDNAQIEKIEAETRQVALNTILNAAGQLPQETILKEICSVFELDLPEVKENLSELINTRKSINTLSDEILRLGSE